MPVRPASTLPATAKAEEHEREKKMMAGFLLFAASIVAGLINALAGGGGLITFPLLMLVVPPVTADATSAVALLSAYPTAVWRTRDQLAGVVRSGWFWLLLILNLTGGLVGALLLTRTGNRNFVALVPWLVLLGTVVIALRPVMVRYSAGHTIHPNFAPAWWLLASVGIFAVAVYGGYFGAGIGILLIGALSFISPGDIRHVVALKNLLCCGMRGVAVIVLVLQSDVAWRYGAMMALGGLIGGYLGGMISHRANRTVVRAIAIGIGFTVAGYYFWKLYGTTLIRLGGE
jgi:uncharacterized protein